jgi:hypothetical protein
VIVLTIDQRGSRRDRDRVPDLLARLASLPTVLPFERTVGDEVQGLLDDPESAVDLTLDVLRTGHWSVGLGLGAVRTPLPGSPRQGAGEAFVAARKAVEAAKSRQRAQPVAVRAAGPAAADAEAVLILLASVRARRSVPGWAAVDTMAIAASQDEAAARLGISQQAVSQRLAAACWAEETAVRPTIARLLREADAGR